MATYPVGAGKAYTTIQSAIAAAGSAIDYDALIPVDSGTYTENLNICVRSGTSHAMPVHVYAANPASKPVIVSTTGSYAVLANVVTHGDAGTRVPKFTNIVWSGGTASTYHVYAANGPPMHFIGCEFLSLTKSIFRFANAGTSTSYRWEIRRCRFDACTGGELLLNNDVGYGLIEGCRFRHTSGAYSMVICATTSHWLAYNNSVSTTAAGGYLFQVEHAKNNAVHVVSSSPLKLFVCTGTFDYNVFNWAGSNSGTNGGHNNASGIPGFANPTTGDFSITSASPCHNAGTALADVTVDYAGTSRPQGGTMDVGAFEVVATTTVSSITVLSSTSIKLNLAASVASDASWANAANFTITTGTGVAVTVSAAVASGNPGTYITLTTSEHTNAATYNVAWSGVTGITSGNSNYTGQGVTPSLSSVMMGATSSLAVTFSEPMTNNAALTTLSNYVLSPGNGGGTFNPVQVFRINSTQLALSIEQGFSASTGTLTVSGMSDLAGNVCSGVTANFTVYTTSGVSVGAAWDTSDVVIEVLLDNLLYESSTWSDMAKWTLVGPAPAVTPIALTYGAAGPAPSEFLTLRTAEQLIGGTYTLSWAGLVGIPNGSAQFSGAGAYPTAVGQMPTPTSVRVTFSEPMTNNAALVNTANYTLSSASTTSFHPISAVRVDSTTVDLGIDRQLVDDPGSLTVVGATDLAGNACQGVAEIFDITVAEVSSVAARNNGTNFFVRLNLSVATYHHSSWEAPGVLTFAGSPTLTATYYGVSGSPATYIDFTTNEPLDTTHYTASWSGLAGVVPNSAQFYGAPIYPILNSATFTSATTLRVVFSESMTNDADLVSASNYTITPVTAPAFNPVSVTRVNATTVDLTVDRSLGKTTGVLSVTGPKDLAGNACNGATADVLIWEVSVLSAVGRWSGYQYYLRLNFSEPVFRDAATWTSSHVLLTGLTGHANYSSVSGSPASWVEFTTNDQELGAPYSVQWIGAKGIANGSLSFTGAGADVFVDGLFMPPTTKVYVAFHESKLGRMSLDGWIATDTAILSDQQVAAAMPVLPPGSLVDLMVDAGVGDPALRSISRSAYEF